MKLTKNIVAASLAFSLLSCTQFNVNQTNPANQSKTFGIKSTTSPNEIKKSLIPEQKLSLGRLEFLKTRTINFNVDDTSRSSILNIVNGPNNTKRVNRLNIKLNGVEILKPFDIPNFDDIDNFNDIKNKLCKDSSIKSCIQDILMGTFNKKTDSLSIELKNLKAGANKLEITLIGVPEATISVSADGFMKPLNIPGAINSRISDTPEIRKMPYIKGRVGLKFLEGMKVRLVNNSDGTQTLVDQNGTSLTSLTRILKDIGVKSIYRGVDVPEDELNQDEIKTEALFGSDAPNMNLFYYINVDEKTDLWSVIDRLRQLPYLEEAFPEFLSDAQSFDKTEPIYTEPNLLFDTNNRAPTRQSGGYPNPNNPLENQWLRKTHISDDFYLETTTIDPSNPPKDTTRAILDQDLVYINDHYTNETDRKNAITGLLNLESENIEASYWPGAWSLVGGGNPNIKIAVIDGSFQIKGILKPHEDLNDNRFKAIINTTSIKDFSTQIAAIKHGTQSLSTVGASKNNLGTSIMLT